MIDKINEVVNILDNFNSLQFPTHYHVIENFNIHGKREYDLINLTMECCDNIIVCNDIEETLYNGDYHVLIGFLLDNLDDVIIIENKIELILVDGIISIDF